MKETPGRAGRHFTGQTGPQTWPTNESTTRRYGKASGMEVDAAEALLGFLSRLSRFGLTAEMEPLLKPLKRGG